jgi:hypothetical protein
MQDMNSKSSIELLKHFGKVVLRSPEKEFKLPMGVIQEEMRLRQEREERQRLESRRQRSIERTFNEYQERFRQRASA